jgi:hypothetical protein
MLVSYAGEPPAFTDAIEECRTLLQDPSALPGLSDLDRAFLLEQHHAATI